MQSKGRCGRLAVASFLLLCGAAVSGAQGNRPLDTAALVAVSGLSFGAIFPGTPEIVTVADAARRAEFLLVGKGAVDVSFILPTALTSASGAQIPLRFEAADAAVYLGAAEGYTAVNPLAATRVRLSAQQGSPRLVLGGRVFPPTSVPVGTYSATVVVVLARPGT